MLLLQNLCNVVLHRSELVVHLMQELRQICAIKLATLNQYLLEKGGSGTSWLRGRRRMLMHICAWSQILGFKAKHHDFLPSAVPQNALTFLLALFIQRHA